MENKYYFLRLIFMQESLHCQSNLLQVFNELWHTVEADYPGKTASTGTLFNLLEALQNYTSYIALNIKISEDGTHQTRYMPQTKYKQIYEQLYNEK